MGEVLHGDYAAIAADAGFDSITQYALWKAAWSALKDRNPHELKWALERHEELRGHLLPWTFVGNHDVTRLATAVGSEPVVLALTVLATVGGVPAIYYGDEQGFTGQKLEQIGGDDAVRPAFPAQPGDLNPIGQWLYRAHQDLIGLRRRHPWLVRARTETLELAATHYVYASRGDGGAITVSLDLEPAPRVEILAGSKTEYRWP